MPSMRLSRRSKILFGVVATIVVLLILASSLSGYYLDYQWFGEVDQQGVFTSVLVTRLILFAVFGVIMAVVIGVNLVVAYRLRPPFRPMSPEQQNLERYRNRIEPRRGLFLGLLLGAVGVVTGLSMQGSWQQWMLWMNGVSFGQTDPQFNLDVSFYAFDYPVYRTMLGFAFTAIVFAFLLSLAVHYVFGAVRLQTPGPKMTLAARRHLTVLVFVFVSLKAVAYWLDRYELVFSQRGQGFDGASYTDINAALPAKTILFYVAIVIALAVLASMWLRSVLVPTTAFVVLLVLSVLANGIYPAVVQQFRVKPNANVLEKQYISNNIAATRAAYGIVTRSTSADPEPDDAGSVDYQDYTATPNPDVADLESTNPTVANIRVLDPNVLSDTFTQQQNLRPFYGFPTKLDIDRYTTAEQTRDYIVSVRELKAANLTGDQTNWINQYTRYTHGYGFVAAAANSDVTNTRSYDEGNIPTTGFLTGDGATSAYEPRVYYGEDMPDYSVVGATGRDAEYDAIDQSFSYGGKGGVGLGSLVNRLAFATHYRQLSFLLNDVATANGAKVIFDRDPRERVQKVAPFLKVDGDPYPAVVGGRTVWFVDGYTTMDNYPYSQRQSLSDLTADTLTVQNRSALLPDDDINYIRNSVKATVDAYDGTVTLYQWDEQDPLLKTWMKAFPGLIHPKSELESNTDLVAHVRYPEDLFNVQRSMLQRYHVDDPVAFYNASSQWTVPADATQVQLTQKPNQPPYYVQASPAATVADDTSTSTDSTFQLTSPMRVQNRTNLAAFLSVDSTPGDDYGRMTVLQVPTSAVVKGPEQVFNDLTSQARIRQDLTLLASAESRVTYGNLLTLPIGNSFLNVMPVYVQSTASTGFPILQRVMVSYGEKLGYAQTLAGALANLAPGQDVGQSIDNNGSSSSDSPSPSTSSTPTGGAGTGGSGTTTAPTSGGTGSVEQRLTVLRQQIADVALQLNEANRAGNYTLAGQLQGQLAQLADEYGRLSASATASPTPTSGSSPPTSSGTPTTPGAGASSSGG